MTIFGMRLAKRGENRRQDLDTHHFARGQPHDAFRLVERAGRSPEKRRRRRSHRFRMRMELQGPARRRKSRLRTREKRLPERGFEFLDVPTQRRLREFELARRGGQASQPKDGQK